MIDNLAIDELGLDVFMNQFAEFLAFFTFARKDFLYFLHEEHHIRVFPQFEQQLAFPAHKNSMF